jgi:hypothetical protein
MEDIPCLDIDGRNIGQEMSIFYGIPKIRYHIQKTPLLDAIMRQFNLAHTIPLISILLLSFCLGLSLPLSSFQIKIEYASVISPMCVPLPLSAQIKFLVTK